MSLGINNVFPKTCSYSCIYCQVGRTDKMTTERREFFPTSRIVSAVNERLDNVDEHVDVITFVPDGEPTLDIGLGQHIKALKGLDMDIAVISNGSLLWMEEVRRDLNEADIVSVKIDSVDEDIWKQIDRPHGNLDMRRVLDGIMRFSEEYPGRLWTETMLVKEVNDKKETLEETASFIKKLNADRPHITVPIRPPAEAGVTRPDDETLALSYGIFSNILGEVSIITGKEEGRFGSTGKLEQDLLSTCSVHPMREDSVRELVERRNGSFDKVDEMVRRGSLKVVEYGGTRFYITSS